LAFDSLRTSAGPLLFVVLFVAVVLHVLSSAYMGYVKCPRCRQAFSERSLLWWTTSLEDQLTTACNGCGLLLQAR
jgi:hypothetical protein